MSRRHSQVRAMKFRKTKIEQRLTQQNQTHPTTSNPIRKKKPEDRKKILQRLGQRVALVNQGYSLVQNRRSPKPQQTDHPVQNVKELPKKVVPRHEYDLLIPLGKNNNYANTKKPDKYAPVNSMEATGENWEEVYQLFGDISSSEEELFSEPPLQKGKEKGRNGSTMTTLSGAEIDKLLNAQPKKTDKAVQCLNEDTPVIRKKTLPVKPGNIYKKKTKPTKDVDVLDIHPNDLDIIF